MSPTPRAITPDYQGLLDNLDAIIARTWDATRRVVLAYLRGELLTIDALPFPAHPSYDFDDHDRPVCTPERAVVVLAALHAVHNPDSAVVRFPAEEWSVAATMWAAILLQARRPHPLLEQHTLIWLTCRLRRFERDLAEAVAGLPASPAVILTEDAGLAAVVAPDAPPQFARDGRAVPRSVDIDLDDLPGEDDALDWRLAYDDVARWLRSVGRGVHADHLDAALRRPHPHGRLASEEDDLEAAIQALAWLTNEPPSYLTPQQHGERWRLQDRAIRAAVVRRGRLAAERVLTEQAIQHCERVLADAAAAQAEPDHVVGGTPPLPAPTAERHTATPKAEKVPGHGRQNRIIAAIREAGRPLNRPGIRRRLRLKTDGTLGRDLAWMVR